MNSFALLIRIQIPAAELEFELGTGRYSGILPPQQSINPQKVKASLARQAKSLISSPTMHIL